MLARPTQLGLGARTTAAQLLVGLFSRGNGAAPVDLCVCRFLCPGQDFQVVRICLLMRIFFCKPMGTSTSGVQQAVY
jgi:hypothetical protein